MKLGIMQPYFFPYIGYFQLIHAVDQFFLYDNLDYSREGWVARNRILVVHGQPAYLSVPIKERKTNQTIRQVKLVDTDHWRYKFLRSVHANYSQTPYYREVISLVEAVFFYPTYSLAELNKNCIVQVCRFLELETDILIDSTPFDDLEFELRDCSENKETTFSARYPDIVDRKIARVLELCRRLNASTFINPIGGQLLYPKNIFDEHGITALFVKTQMLPYSQRAHSFFPNLSIIDVLMNCGREKTRNFLSSYDLV